MTRDIYDACADELLKISVKLSPAEERGQLLRFGAMGAAAVPIVSGLANTIQHGRPWAVGTNLKRWLPAQMLTGALFGGVLPTARHKIERATQERARDRQDMDHLMQQTGMKTASSPGQDLRLPITGGTKMPTDDSKGHAKSLLNKSQNSAEVGPVASAKSFPTSGITIRDVIPKFGAVMSDPLIEYLRKEALENNEKDPQKDPAYLETNQKELTSDGKDPDVFGSAVSSYHAAIKRLFTNSKAHKGKYLESDYKGGVTKEIAKIQRDEVAKSSHRP